MRSTFYLKTSIICLDMHVPYLTHKFKDRSITLSPKLHNKHAIEHIIAKVFRLLRT